MNSASPAVPVYVVPDSELKKNGGQYYVEGRPAIPITGATAATINSGDAEAGQALVADGNGGVEFVNVGGGAVLAENPPFTAAAVPSMLVFEGVIPADETQSITVDLTSLVAIANTFKASAIQIRASEDGGLSALIIDIFVFGGAASVANIEQPTSSITETAITVPLDAGRFEIKLRGVGAQVSAIVYVAFICGFP